MSREPNAGDIWTGRGGVDKCEMFELGQLQDDGIFVVQSRFPKILFGGPWSHRKVKAGSILDHTEILYNTLFIPDRNSTITPKDNNLKSPKDMSSHCKAKVHWVFIIEFYGHIFCFPGSGFPSD